MSIEDGLALFLKDREKTCTSGIVRWYHSHLTAFAILLPSGLSTDLSTVTLADLDAHLVGLRSRLSPVTIRKRAAALRTFFRWCSGTKLTTGDLSAGLNLPKVGRRLPKCLKRTEVHRLLAAIEDLRERAVIELLLDSGLRLNEATQLRWRDLDFEEGTIHVSHGKGDKERYAVFGASTAASLLAWRADRLFAPDPSDRVFLGERGPLSSAGMYKLVKRVAKRAEVEMHPHSLRHTFAVFYLDAGGSIYDLSRLMGHGDIKTTTIYLDVSLESLSEKHGRFSPMNQMRSEVTPAPAGRILQLPERRRVAEKG